MDPKVWGPHAWFFLHCITLVYPNNPTEEDKQNMKQYFTCLEKVLPCHKCRQNFGMHLDKFPINDKVLSSRDELVKWLIDIHNESNKQTNNKQLKYSEVIEKFIGNQKKFKFDIMNIILISLLLFILAVLCYKNFKR